MQRDDPPDEDLMKGARERKGRDEAARVRRIGSIRRSGRGGIS